MNRPLEVPISEVLTELGMKWGGENSAKAWLGGPVTPESGWVLFEGDPADEGVEAANPSLDASMILGDGLRISPSIECLRALAENPPRHLRLLLGYAGWGAGQLEEELVEGSWMFVPMSRALVFETPAAEMWAVAYRQLGVDPSSLVPAPGIQ